MQSYRDETATTAGASSFTPVGAPLVRSQRVSNVNDDLGKYRNLYEQTMNPFEAFRGRVSSLDLPSQQIRLLATRKLHVLSKRSTRSNGGYYLSPEQSWATVAHGSSSSSMLWVYTHSYYSLVTSALQSGPCLHHQYPAVSWIAKKYPFLRQLIHHRVCLNYRVFLSEACCSCPLIRIMIAWCLLSYIMSLVSFPVLGLYRPETELAKSFILKLQYRV